jgi:hypothetical protein
MPQDAFNRDELRDDPAYFVLRLTVASRTFYVSDVLIVDAAGLPVGITRDDATVISVQDGMSPIDWTSQIALGQTNPPVTSVPIRLTLPAADWAEMERDGFDLAAATGELSKWLRGQTWEKRKVLVRGNVIEPQYGSKGEPLAFSLKSMPFEDRSAYPPATAIVDDTTWPSAANPAKGRYYPTIIGYPGRLDGGGTRDDGSPGLIVNMSSRTLLIAGHEVQATRVDVRDTTILGAYANLPVTTTTDGRGRTVSVVTLPTTGAATYVASDEYHVSWFNTSSASDGGGLFNRRRTGVLRDAGDVLDFFLDLTTLKVDQGRVAAAVGLLRGFKIDGYWDDPAGVWSWIQGNLLPILPISIQAGPDGLYPVVWQYDVLQTGTVDTIDADRGDGYRVGPVKKTTTLFGNLANEFRVEFSLDADTGTYRQHQVVHGDPADVSTTDFVPSPACRRSRSRYSPLVPSVMTTRTDMVYDRATATAICNWQALLHALPVRRVSYVVPMRFDHIRAGAAVEITDTDIHLSAVRALVEEKEDLGDGQLRLALAIIEGALQ